MLTSGTIAAIILIPLGVIALAIAIVLLAKARKAYDPENFWLGAGVLGMFAIPAIACPVIGMALVGYSGEYMAYKPVSGTVEQVASRQIADGKAMSQRFVFKINGQEYGVDDTRASLVKAGDAVNLNCAREFVWGSTNNGYACNWG